MNAPRLVAGRYRILRLLGRGGMGEVWLARDERLDRHVALKLLRDPPDQHLAQRFVREARAAAMLVHPGIVTVFDYGEEDGQLYIAMEFVEGEPLSETIRARRPLGDATRLRLMSELCAALAHAHARNVVHRDIKPGNLMLGSDGRLRVLDFGIARHGPSTLTAGHLIGSLNYMAPEQIELRAVDARSDIFAAGAVFYELLTGQQAFPGSSPEEIAAKIRTGAPAPIEHLAPSISAEVAAIVSRALERDPDQRYPHIAVMQRAIDAARRSAGGADAETETVTFAIAPPPHDAHDGPTPQEMPRRRTDRVALERRRAAEIQQRLAEARAAAERGDLGVAADAGEAVLLLDPGNAEAQSLLDRIEADRAAAAPQTDGHPADRFLARTQARLLNRRARVDYLLLAGLGLVPIALAWQLGTLGNTPLTPGSDLYAVCGGVGPGGAPRVVLGYGSRANWWPYFAIMPFTLFMVRFTASRFFPIEPSPASINRGLLLRVDARHRAGVGARLARAALDPRNLAAVLALAMLINAIDLAELARIYLGGLRGQPVACPRELDWTVHFLTRSSSLPQNAALVGFAYANQFLIHALAMMLYGLLLRHNWFYLRAIYQRHRAGRRPARQFIVLDFDDVERCFGLRGLHATFNLQIMLLILGGVLITASRALNVNPTGVSQRYQQILSMVFSAGTESAPAPAVPVRLGDLFPDAGQIMLAIAWLLCFAIVAMPGAVKFLPLLYRHLHIVGRREYLSEFLPPDRTPPLETPDQVDALAMKFARSSFWPAGDERARTLYVLAYFVLFFVLVPMPPDERIYLAAHLTTLLALSIVCMRLTFWLFQKFLINVDASLARP